MRSLIVSNVDLRCIAAIFRQCRFSTAFLMLMYLHPGLVDKRVPAAPGRVLKIIARSDLSGVILR